MKAQDKILIGAGAVLLGIFLWKKLGGISGIAQAAVQGAEGAAVGTVKAIGASVGVPDTNVSKGQQDIAQGNWWQASFDLPAGQFLNEVGSAVGSGIFDMTHPGQ